MVLILSGLFITQSCKKEAVITPTGFTIAMPGAPSPAIDEVVPFTGTGQTINLTWTGAGSSPTVWAVFYGTKSSPALVASNVTADSYTVTLTKGGTYYWQVSTTDANNENTTSPVWSFEVNSNPAVPSGPVPATAAVGVSKSVRLSWNGSDPEGDALTYDVYLGKTAVPTTIVATGISDTTFAVSTPVTTSAKYYWKIVAHDPYGGVAESPVWNFTVTSDVLTAFTGDYNADEPAEAYSYVVSFSEVATKDSVSTDNYWNSGWVGTFGVNLTARTYSMPLTVWSDGYSGIESGVVNPTTGTMTGTYTIWSGTKIAEQGVHTYTKP